MLYNLSFSPLVVPEMEGEGDSISSLCTQITTAFSGPPEDPFTSAPMPKPSSSPQSPIAPGKTGLEVFRTICSSVSITVVVIDL